MRWVERERVWSSGDIVIGGFDVDGEALGLGLRIWGSDEVEARGVVGTEEGGLGGFMEKGFLEAEAIVSSSEI